MTCNIDLSALNRTIFYQLPPGRIHHGAAVIALQQIAAGRCRGLAICIELFECRFVNGQGSKPCLLRLTEDLLCRHAFALRQFNQTLIIDGHIHRHIILFNRIPLDIHRQSGNQTQYDKGDEPSIIVEYLHLSITHLTSLSLQLTTAPLYKDKSSLNDGWP